jgi:hypothetical protein
MGLVDEEDEALYKEAVKWYDARKQEYLPKGLPPSRAA